MGGTPDREEASRLLGVSLHADPLAIKRAYRRRARELHPDLGGDPETFHRLRLAFERLMDPHDEVARPPVVSRGRPSRPPVPFLHPDETIDTTSVDWHQAGPAEGTSLTRERVASWLAHPSPGPVRPLIAASRAPGSRLNRFAGSLSDELTSTLTIRPDEDDRGREIVSVSVSGGSRRSRRALDEIELDEVWTRTRGSSSTRLSTWLLPSGSRRATALRTTERAGSLLAALAWPLESWKVVQG